MTGDTHEPCRATLFRTFADDSLLQQVRDEFGEIPGLRLTFDQAMRLWRLDRQTCTTVLGSLVEAHFLERDSNGRYIRIHSY